MSKVNEMPKLRPCPFCTSEAVIARFVMWTKPRWKKRKVKGAYYVVGCSDPDCILYLDDKCKQARLMFKSRSKEFIARRWNRRILR